MVCGAVGVCVQFSCENEAWKTVVEVSAPVDRSWGSTGAEAFACDLSACILQEYFSYLDFWKSHSSQGISVDEFINQQFQSYELLQRFPFQWPIPSVSRFVPTH